MIWRKINRKGNNRQEKKKNRGKSLWLTVWWERNRLSREHPGKEEPIGDMAVRVKAWWVSDMTAQGGRHGTTAGRNHPQSDSRWKWGRKISWENNEKDYGTERWIMRIMIFPFLYMSTTLREIVFLVLHSNIGFVAKTSSMFEEKQMRLLILLHIHTCVY